MKKTVALLLALALLAACMPALALTSAQKESNFSAAVQQLEAYLESSENDPGDLLFIQNAFDQLERYNHSNFFKYYATVLWKIENNEFDHLMEIYLGILDDPNFIDYLSSLDSLAILPVEELKNYALGRKSQFEGDFEQACQYYSQCLTFYDSDERYFDLQSVEIQAAYDEALELLADEKYAEAYQKFLTTSKFKDSEVFIAYIEKMLGGAPESAAQEPTREPESTPAPQKAAAAAEKFLLTVSASAGCNTLRWDAVDGAISYTIQRHKTNASYTVLNTTQQTSYKDYEVAGGSRYYYTVIANLQSGSTISSDEAIVVAVNKSPNATAKPAAHTHSWIAANCTRPKTCSECGATEGSALGHNWQPATESAPKTCSRCGVTEGNKLSWSAWSAWSTTPVTETSSRRVQTEVRREQTGSQTTYSYSRFYYYNKDESHYQVSYADNWAKARGYSGNWQYHSTTAPLSQNGTVDGQKRYNGPSQNGFMIWFNQSTSTEPIYSDVTYYRYQTLI